MEANDESKSEKDNSESIFTEDEFSLEGYDKSIKQARNTLFVIAAVQFLLAVYLLIYSQQASKWISVGISTLMAVIFFALGLFTKTKPYTAIVSALTIYILLWISDCIIDSSYIFKGILIKIILIVYLIKGLKDAKEAQDMKTMM